MAPCPCCRRDLPHATPGFGHGWCTMRGMAFVHETLPQRVALERAVPPDDSPTRWPGSGRGGSWSIAAGSASAVADQVTAGLPEAVRWHEVRQHVPVELAERARAAAAEASVDAIVTVGGGSTTGLGKAVALTTGLPIIAVPTTYAGSEATAVWGLTEGRASAPGWIRGCCPLAVVYDASLSRVAAGGRLSVASGLNALAHCVDASGRRAPIRSTRPSRLEGVRALAPGLPRVVADPADGRAASRSSTAAISRRSRSPRRVRGCITRSATCSAAPTTCLMRRPMRSCCPTCWRTTLRPCPASPPGSSRPWAGPCRRPGRCRCCRGRRAGGVAAAARGAARAA